MSSSSRNSNNPYQSPAAADPFAPSLAGANLVTVKLLKDFRAQIHALGAFWIIIGLVAAGLGLMMIRGDNAPPVTLFSLLFLGVGLAWFGLGIGTCLKQMWSVYVALVLSYLSLAVNLVSFNLCGLIIVAVVILQAHRVINWAKQLTAAGIPLNAHPSQFAPASAIDA